MQLLRDERENGQETTHALFAEVGGSAADGFCVISLPTKRVFRSKFAEYLFKTRVAPVVL